MDAWITIVTSVVVGLGSGALGTVWAAKIAAGHDSRMRLRDLTVAEYARALSAMEEVVHVTRGEYARLNALERKTKKDEDSARRLVDDVRTSTAARQAPAKLLGSPDVEQAIHEFDQLVARELVPSMKTGRGGEVFAKLSKVHDEAVAAMQHHLGELDDWKRRSR